MDYILNGDERINLKKPLNRVYQLIGIFKKNNSSKSFCFARQKDGNLQTVNIVVNKFGDFMLYNVQKFEGMNMLNLKSSRFSYGLPNEIKKLLSTVNNEGIAL